MIVLPFEIIQLVNDYLQHDDRYQLIQVNHTFYQLFIQLLYRAITIKSNQQWKQLIHLFEQQQDCYLGQYVHQLVILLDQLEQYELQQIQSLCPFVQSVHIDWRIWNYLSTPNTSATRNYLPRSFLSPFAIEFISNYGACKLSSLTLDVYHIEHVEITQVLCYTPHLRNLTLMGMNREITINIDLIETIHQACPYLETLSLEGYTMEASYTRHHKIQPTKRLKSFKIQSQYGADRYQQWFPYLGAKYPHLATLEFHHLGDSKDIIEPCSTRIYTQFIRQCPKLKSICWNNSVPDFRFFQEASQLGMTFNRLELYDSIAIPSLFTTVLFDSCLSTLVNVTRFTFGPVPRGMMPHEFIVLISKACPQLKHLHLCEPQCNLTLPFKIDSILDHCKKLTSLTLDRIALRVSFGLTTISDLHPLKKLTMRHCSSFDGVFDHISPRCPSLEELNLFAYTQRDRRYKVQIHLPHQKLKKISLHGLRTESFDLERRIRFFSIQQLGIEEQWYFLKKYGLDDESRSSTMLEVSHELQALNVSEIRILHALLDHPMSWSDVEHYKREYLVHHVSHVVKDWHPKDIYDAGYVDIQCQSVDMMYINKKKLL
jgi:hypothetical protein